MYNYPGPSAQEATRQAAEDARIWNAAERRVLGKIAKYGFDLCEKNPVWIEPVGGMRIYHVKGERIQFVSECARGNTINLWRDWSELKAKEGRCGEKSSNDCSAY